MSRRISITQIIDEILAHIAHKPLVVFDLDSTLFDVSPRTQLIVERFVADPQMQKRFPAEVEFLKTFKILRGDWGLRQPLERSGFKSTQEFARTIRDYWRKNFFSSDHLMADVPYEGAIESVKRLHEAGAEIMYLTGRDEINMRRGTIEGLRHWRLPLTENTANLIMKPVKGSLEDHEYKEIEMKRLALLNSNIWFFENEPVIIHRVRLASPQVKIIFVDTTHSGRAEAPADLPILDWES